MCVFYSWTSLIFWAGVGAMSLPLLHCLLHVYLFIEINYLIQGLLMENTRMSITILPDKVSSASSHPSSDNIVFDMDSYLYRR